MLVGPLAPQSHTQYIGSSGKIKQQSEVEDSLLLFPEKRAKYQKGADSRHQLNLV